MSQLCLISPQFFNLKFIFRGPHLVQRFVFSFSRLHIFLVVYKALTKFSILSSSYSFCKNKRKKVLSKIKREPNQQKFYKREVSGARVLALVCSDKKWISTNTTTICDIYDNFQGLFFQKKVLPSLIQSLAMCKNLTRLLHESRKSFPNVKHLWKTFHFVTSCQSNTFARIIHVRQGLNEIKFKCISFPTLQDKSLALAQYYILPKKNELRHL